MNFFGKFLALLITVAATTRSDITPDIQSDPPSLLRATLRKFSKPRHHVTNPRGKEKVRKFIKRVFRKSGLRVWSEYIDVQSSLRGENIVGMLRGTNTGTADDRVLIVGAHYDTTSRTRGVDDNGSGVTALLQAAKQIGKSGCRFKNTILFVAFDFEEDTTESKLPIPFGSQSFVRNLTKNLQLSGGKIKGALILEMLANYNSSKGSQHIPRLFSYISPQAHKDITRDGKRGNFLAVVGRKDADKALLEPLKKYYKNDTEFKIHLVPIPLAGRPSKSPYFSHLRTFFRSDHYNFWENNVSIPAVMITDTSNFRAKMNKCYHRRCDSMRQIDKLDLEFLRRNINAVIRTTLDLSQAESCRRKKHHRLKADLSRSSTKSAVVNLPSFKNKTESKSRKIQRKVHYKRNKTFAANYAHAESCTILTILVTFVNSLLHLRR